MIQTVPPLPDWVERYLRLLSATGLERTAAAGAGTTVRKVNQLRADNTEFDYACIDSEEQAADALELEARRRAVEGTEKGVYYQGERVDYQTEYSDTLLGKLLTGRREGVFGDKRKISGAYGEPLTINVRTFTPSGQPTNPPIEGTATRVLAEPSVALRVLDVLDLV